MRDLLSSFSISKRDFVACEVDSPMVSREARDTRLTAAHDDPECGEVVTRQERNPSTKLIEKVHNIDMLPSGGYSAIAIAP